MSIETRHTEKNLLYMLLKAQNCAEKPNDFDDIIHQLTAVMEKEDVELVKSVFNISKKNNK